MRVPINLASDPLENLRPLRAAVAVAALAALVLGGVIATREWRSRSEFRSLIQQQADVEQRLRALETEQKQLEEALSTEQARRVRERSAFLNSLILRKSLSWTRLFMDLEKTLPARARITAIHPRLSADEEVSLNLTVLAPSIEPLVEFLKNLESSAAFGAPIVGSQRNLSERSAEAGVELELTTRYVQDRSGNLPASAQEESAAAEERIAAATGKER